MQGASYFQLLNPMVMLIFAIGFLLIYRSDNDLKSARLFALGYASGAIGFTLDFTIRDSAGPILGHYVSNIWLVAIPGFITCGIAQRHGENEPFKAVVVCYLAAFAIATYCIFAELTWPARAMAMNVGTGVLLGLSIPILWRARENALARLLLVLVSLSVIQFFVRPVLVLIYSGQDLEMISYSNSLYAQTLHFTSAICAIAIAATLLFSLGHEIVSRLNHRGNTDSMTGLLNRLGFTETAENAIEKAHRTSAAVSLIFADIDHFKAINDKFGHQVGDRVITAFGKQIADLARVSDVAGRVGGEEFAVLLWNADASGAQIFAEALRANWEGISTDLSLDGKPSTASFGVATLSHKDETLDDLIGRADDGLYEAKQAGRNQVRSAKPFGRTEVAGHPSVTSFNPGTAKIA